MKLSWVQPCCLSNRTGVNRKTERISLTLESQKRMKMSSTAPLPIPNKLLLSQVWFKGALVLASIPEN